VTDVAAVAAAIDETFRGAMRTCGIRGGPALRERHPAGFAAMLVEFRTALAGPDGCVSMADFAEVIRYRDPVEEKAGLVAAVERGSILRGPDGAFRATSAGRDFLTDLYASQASVLATLWSDAGATLSRVAGTLADLVAAAATRSDRPGCFHAMEPAFEPPGIGACVLVLNRLSALRYARSDAHAAAWRAAGLSAAEMVALQEAGGPDRDRIEMRTNELTAPVFAGADLERLTTDLRSLPLE
jgi:hypothetical protein